MQSHERRNQKSRGHQQDAVKFGVPCATDPLLPERVLPDCGIPTVGVHEAGIQCHIILVVGAIGATSRLPGHSKTHIILQREGDADETLSNSEMGLNRLKMQRGPRGPGTTIGTVSVRRGNSLEGLTCH
jgi:hypothetical protein